MFCFQTAAVYSLSEKDTGNKGGSWGLGKPKELQGMGIVRIWRQTVFVGENIKIHNKIPWMQIFVISDVHVTTVFFWGSLLKHLCHKRDFSKQVSCRYCYGLVYCEFIEVSSVSLVCRLCVRMGSEAKWGCQSVLELLTLQLGWGKSGFKAF